MWAARLLIFAVTLPYTLRWRECVVGAVADVTGGAGPAGGAAEAAGARGAVTQRAVAAVARLAGGGRAVLPERTFLG